MSRKDTLTDIQAEADLDQRRREMHDAFTGELFTARARNHYEDNNGKPRAPQVDTPRPTVRQRIENLINRGVDPLHAYVRSMGDASEGIDMDIPDDPDAPLTFAEQNHIDIIAAELAEQAPLPDEGLTRPPTEPAQPPSPAASGGAGGSSPPAEGPSGAGPAPSGAPPKAP